MSENFTKVYKRLKLDKFINGKQQRIFKTKINVIQTNYNNLNEKINFYDKHGKNIQIFYGKYSNELTLNATDRYENCLINFHQINYDYENNRPDKLKLNTVYNDNNNYYFTLSANIIKNLSQQQNNQRISYFPNYIYTPLDIAQFRF